MVFSVSAVLAEVPAYRIPIIVLLAAVLWIGPAYLGARLAARKGYSAPMFFAAGVVLLGLLTPLVALVLPARAGRT